MTAVAIVNGKKVEMTVYRLVNTTNENFKHCIGDVCIAGKLKNGSVSIRLLASHETIMTSALVSVEVTDDGKSKKLITKNSVYQLEAV